jgi:hypothetical protein
MCCSAGLPPSMRVFSSTTPVARLWGAMGWGAGWQGKNASSQIQLDSPVRSRSPAFIPCQPSEFFPISQHFRKHSAQP